MTILTLELTDEQAQKWTEEAQRLNLTPQQLVTRRIEERLAERKKYVSQAIKRIIGENEVLYRQLIIC